MKSESRRHILSRTAVLASSALLSQVVKAVTPKSTEGPFYPTPAMRFDDTDNDLVKVDDQVKNAGGEIIRLTGKVLSSSGLPLQSHRIEIWQCDVNGKYLHTGDKRNVVYDQGFQGFGHDITGTDGAYNFRTIMPTRYPGRTPHIHVKVCEGDRELLTTQFYIAGHEDNAADGLFRRLSAKQAQSVLMVFNERNGAREANINVVI